MAIRLFTSAATIVGLTGSDDSIQPSRPNWPMRMNFRVTIIHPACSDLL